MKNNLKTKPRIVFDSNVLISALVFSGKPARVVELLDEGIIEVVLSEEIFTELRRKIISKFSEFRDDLEIFEALLRQGATIVDLGEITVTDCRDPDDNRIIETALTGKCEYIISGDKDLLSMNPYRNIVILKPTEVLEQLDA